MTFLNLTTSEAVAGLALLVLATAFGIWWVRRRRPSADEIERTRRADLASAGRVVDGMLLDVRQLQIEDRALTMLEYSYRISGVEYECSQDVTSMQDVVDPAEVRAGFPCSVRYMPGSPQNSIVVAEEWSGLRVTLPKIAMLRGSLQETSQQTQQTH